MNLEQIREKVRLGQWRISKHAVVEAAKDGLSPRHIKEIILTGRIIESYPERERHLIYGMLPDGIPVHVVIDYSNPEQMVSCYCIYTYQRGMDYISEKKEVNEMRCVECKVGETTVGTTSLTYTRPGSKLQVLVAGVPADVCSHCGEAYLSEAVAQEVFEIVDGIFPIISFDQTFLS